MNTYLFLALVVSLTSSRGMSFAPHLFTHSKGIRLHTFMCNCFENRKINIYHGFSVLKRDFHSLSFSLHFLGRKKKKKKKEHHPPAALRHQMILQCPPRHKFIALWVCTVYIFMRTVFHMLLCEIRYGQTMC